MTKTATIRLRIVRCNRTASTYRAIRAQLARKIEQIDGSDIEDREAARVWSQQLSHAEYCEAEAQRYAQYARNELAG